MKCRLPMLCHQIKMQLLFIQLEIQEHLIFFQKYSSLILGKLVCKIIADTIFVLKYYIYIYCSLLSRCKFLDFEGTSHWISYPIYQIKAIVNFNSASLNVFTSQLTGNPIPSMRVLYKTVITTLQTMLIEFARQILAVGRHALKTPIIITTLELLVSSSNLIR